MSDRGSQRERAVRDLMTRQGWLAFRAPASLGIADVVALQDGLVPQLIEVKSTKAGPYHSFGPEKRRALADAAKRAGADAYLAWWPSRGTLTWIPEAEWPA